jgi:hypothetical protein
MFCWFTVSLHNESGAVATFCLCWRAKLLQTLQQGTTHQQHFIIHGNIQSCQYNSMCLKPIGATGKKEKKVTQISSLFSSINPGCDTVQSKIASDTNGSSAMTCNML